MLDQQLLKITGFFTIFVVFGLLITSCKKKADEELPYVKVLVPAENADFYVLDTLNITVEASDNRNLEYVKISLVDKNFVPVLPAVFAYPEEKETYVYQALVIDDLYLETDDYYILARASDGENEKMDYREIQVYELEREFQGVWFSQERPANNLVDVYAVDDNFQMDFIRSVSGDFGAAAISGRLRSYFTAGGVFGDLNAISTQSGSVNWTVPSEGTPPQPYFNDAFYDDQVVYASSSDGQIRGFGSTGEPRFSANAGNFIPQELFVNDLHVFNEQMQISGGQKKLAVYLKNTSAFWQSRNTDLDIVAICERDAEHILVLGNDGGQGYLKEYDMEENGFWQPHDLPSGKVYDAVAVSDNDFLIAHETGVLWYTHNPNSLVNIISGVQASEIKYEDISGIIVLAVGSEMRFYGFPAGNFINTVAHSDTICGIELLYNK